MGLLLSRLYVILDAALLREPAPQLAGKLVDAGVRVLQYRAKDASARDTLAIAKQLAQLARQQDATLVVNDRPDLAYLSNAHGVHLGQYDLTVDQARSVLGLDRWVGVSTHNREQFIQAAASSADYIAIGPMFPTTSKANPDPVVGTEILRQLRLVTTKPIVAIGGIRLESAAEVLAAGADSVAVISDILLAHEPATRAREFLARLDAAKPAASH